MLVGKQAGNRGGGHPQEKLGCEHEADFEFGKGKPVEPDGQIGQNHAVHPERRPIGDRAAQLEEPGRCLRRI
jgi:hypothetical protein